MQMTGKRLEALRLIGITDRNVLGLGDPVHAAEEALASSLPALMLREKDLPEDQLLPIATRLRRQAAQAGALFIINRNIDVARGVGADGVHLGVEGPSLAEARDALGRDALLGYSAHDLNEVLRAFDAGADYVTFSPIYETPSKAGILRPVGLEALARVVGESPGPVIALGGIDESNLSQVLQAGAHGVAVIRAIFGNASPREATTGLVRAIASFGQPLPPNVDSPAAPPK